MKINDNKSEKFWIIFSIVTFAFLLRAAAAVGFFSTFDTYWYRNWAVDLPNGLFSVYKRADLIQLDYPPLYLILLYPIGLVYKVTGTEINDYAQMALLKFWPVVFDVLTVIAIYLLLRRKNQNIALLCSGLWAVNPSAVFNSSFWGQTDSVMVFFLLLAFFYLYEQRFITASVLFAVAGLIKYQSLFFTPVFLLYIWFKKKDIKIFLKSVLAAAVTVAVVFLPFMIGSGNPLLFFDVYFGGAGTYKYCTLNACNTYALLGLNWKPDSGGYGIIGLVTVAIALVFIFIIFKKSRHLCPFAGGLLIMQCIFMFATRMHERYQFAVLIFALLCYAVNRNTAFLGVFSGLSIITFLNQALLLFMWHSPENPIFNYYDQMLMIISFLNIILFFYSSKITVKLFLTDKEETTENVPSVQ